MERGGVRHRYRGCDVTNIVNIMLYTMDMMSSYIADEISINTSGVISSIQWM